MPVRAPVMRTTDEDMTISLIRKDFCGRRLQAISEVREVGRVSPKMSVLDQLKNRP
jgi:hypothetical protein